MPMKRLVMLALLVLASCGHQMSACTGPIGQLNVGQWTPTPEDLR